MLNVLQCKIACCSVSILLQSQYTQMRLCKGVTGDVCRPVSILNLCAEVRKRLSQARWFLLFICRIYGSGEKDPLMVL